jgi:hypothetical protein
VYIAADSGTCILKKDAFYGSDDAATTGYPAAREYSLESVCLAAFGAPLVMYGGE